LNRAMAEKQKHSYPFQSKQLESNKYCKPKDFLMGPSAIREAAQRRMRQDNDITIPDEDPARDAFRTKLDEMVPNPSKLDFQTDLRAI